MTTAKIDPAERTGGAYEADAKTGKLKRTEPEMQPAVMPEAEAAPVEEAPPAAPATTTAKEG
ncbi:MAG: hypothetical protein DI629_03445 [Mesorhizobium amorphae]|nr:MAG: hypothetical protein DI629_03445 [Mesorhizobium amorphae]